MEKISKIFIANSKWYTNKIRKDAQKGLLNDIKYILYYLIEQVIMMNIIVFSNQKNQVL